MFKKTCVILTLVVIGLSNANIALAESCKTDGYTVVFVNGVFTSEEEARAGMDEFKKDYFLLASGRNNVTFKLGYNPSHLAGVGDIAQAVSQVMGSSMSDFDLQTILMQVHSEITTQKILLVGHSQGTLYTNEMYKYLTTHGVPVEAIAVYNLATPASSVSGGGKYLTSGNDNLINTVREWTASVGAPQPLPANVLLPPSSADIEELFRGHAFSREYLAQGAGTIVSDIDNLLSGLKTGGTVSGSESGCFDSPVGTFSYRMQKFGFAIADPSVTAIRIAVVNTGKTMAAVGSSVKYRVLTVIENAHFGLFSGQDKVTQNTASVGSIEYSQKTIFELELPPVPDDLLQEEVETEEEVVLGEEGPKLRLAEEVVIGATRLKGMSPPLGTPDLGGATIDSSPPNGPPPPGGEY